MNLNLPIQTYGHRFKFSIEGVGNSRHVVFDQVSLRSSPEGHLQPFIRIDYVVTSDGMIKFGDAHSFISNAASSVKLAGECRFNPDGKIIFMSNKSGHYPVPTAKFQSAEPFWIETGLFADGYQYVPFQ